MILKKFTQRFLGPSEEPLAKEGVGAVFLVAFQNGKLLSVQNERGWDTPGGHIEGGEESFQALRREVLEEAGAEVHSAIPYAVLASASSSKVMLFFASNDVSLVTFVTSTDALDRSLLDGKSFSTVTTATRSS